MDSFGFSLKRADQRMLAFQRALLRPLYLQYRLTPARYLILFLISKSGFNLGGKRGRSLFQSEIVEKLGVTRATISVALRSMEKFGLIKREPCIYAPRRRKKMVSLTDLGKALLKVVEREIIRPGVVWIAVHTVLGSDRSKVGGTQFWLDRIRRGFLDAAGFLYPPTKRELFPKCVRSEPPPFMWPAS